MVTPRYRAIVFDLFGTLVHFRGRPDPAVDWLREPFAAVVDPARFDEFRAALRAVSQEIMAGRGDEHREVTTGERFARVLARLGVGEAAADALAEAHMRHLAGFTEMPDDHPQVLAALAARYRLALVSNFDHTATALAVLARHGIDRYFDTILISAEFGWRKPNPTIFAEALRRLDVAPSEALYVGDTHLDDVVGALAAGLDVAWLATPDTAGDPRPTHHIADLKTLLDLL